MGAIVELQKSHVNPAVGHASPTIAPQSLQVPKWGVDLAGGREWGDGGAVARGRSAYLCESDDDMNH